MSDHPRPEVRPPETDLPGTVEGLVAESPVRWRMPPTGEMRVPGVIFASQALLSQLLADQALQQVANVATLPGIVEASYAMPDVHWGYGFPIGGVAATDVLSGGVVSPGGVGFDISCGVRLLVSPLTAQELRPSLAEVMAELDRRIPRGAGPGGVWDLHNGSELTEVLAAGARYAVERGHGNEQDLERCEDRGAVEDADPAAVSERARMRGMRQVGSLGAGNHFLEIQTVDAIFRPALAKAFGLEMGQVCVMIHCGSRGLGHQVCSDHVREMLSAMDRYGIELPDPQLACAPVDSPEGSAYLGAMAAAANYGRANRQLLTVATREAFAAAGEGHLDVLYDVSHNLAKLERHPVVSEGGKSADRVLCVHRKGATLALPPQHPDLPPVFALTGQPVLVPGSMGTSSDLLVGASGSAAFHSSAHGAGRTMSRHAAARRIRGIDLRDELEAAGVTVKAGSDRSLAEEAPLAYKDVNEVVEVCEQAGLGRRVARLRPLGVIKG